MLTLNTNKMGQYYEGLEHLELTSIGFVNNGTDI